jgi:hypothetical protein
MQIANGNTLPMIGNMGSSFTNAFWVSWFICQSHFS